MVTIQRRPQFEMPLLSSNKKRKFYSEDPTSLRKSIYQQLYEHNAAIELINTADQQHKKNQTKLKLHDLQQFILWLFHCDVDAPNWIKVRHKHELKQVVMIQVDGLTKYNAATLPVFQKNFTSTHCYELRADTSIFSINGVVSNYLKLETNTFQQSKSCYQEQCSDLENLLLTEAEMRANLYPKEDQPEYKDFVNTKNWFDAKYPYDLLAIDCEMVKTSEGLELCRCSVVDIEGNTLMNRLVKPRRRILSYCTEWSGVSAETLKGVRSRVEDIHRDLRR